MRVGVVGIALVWLLPALSGCGSGRIATYPVKGKVIVDSQPAKGVHVSLHPKGSGDHTPYFPSGQTDDNGEFSLATFAPGDGAPAGEYDVIMTWPVRKNPISTLWEGDKLNGRYKDKSKPAATVTVEKRPQDLEPFKLSTTASPK